MKKSDDAQEQQQPRYNGATVFLPDVSKLRRGDILLTRSAEGGNKPGLAQAKFIRAASRGGFDHALICTSPPTFVEALGEGVKTLSVQNGFTHELAHVRLLRYPDADVAERAAMYAQRQVGRHYSTKKAMASVFPSSVVDEITERGTFCSALVAQAFVDAGSSSFLQANVGKTTPATLEHMSMLNDITEQVFRPVLAPPNVESMVPLDGDRPVSKSQAQTEITGRYADGLLPLANTIVFGFPEADLEAPDSFYDCLILVMDAIDATGRISEASRDAYVGAVMALDSKAAELIGSGELVVLHEKLAQHDAAEIRRNVEESFKSKPDIDIPAMAALLEATYGQIKDRTEALAGFRAWGLHNSEAMTAWVDLQEITVAPFRNRAAACEEILRRIG